MGDQRVIREINIQRVPCPLYDYMVFNELTKIKDTDSNKNGDNKRKYYLNRYGYNFLSDQPNSPKSSMEIFKESLLYNSENLGETKLAKMINDKQSLIIIPIFFKDDIYQGSKITLKNFFKRPDVSLSKINNYHESIKSVLKDDRVYFLPCLIKASNNNNKIKTEQDYKEQLQISINTLRKYIETENRNLFERGDSNNVIDSIVFFVDPGDNISLNFYKQNFEKSKKKLHTEQVGYLNKYLIPGLIKTNEKRSNFKFDDFIPETRIDPLYSLKGIEYKNSLKNENENVTLSMELEQKKLKIIANDIIQWFIFNGTEPDYYSITSDVLKIFYKENIPKSTFDFKLQKDTVYSLYFSKGGKCLNFKFHPSSYNQLKPLTNKTAKENSQGAGLPKDYLKINQEFIRDKKVTYETSNLYLKVKSLSITGIIQGELYMKNQNNIYQKSNLLDEYDKQWKGIVRLKSSENLVYYNASKLNRRRGDKDNDINYFPNFLITRTSLKDFLKEQGVYTKEQSLSNELAGIIYNQERINDFYNFCSSHSKHSKNIQDNISVTRVIDNILKILFYKNSPFYKNSKADTDDKLNVTTTGYNEYYIKDFSKKEELYIKSEESYKENINSLKIKYPGTFPKLLAGIDKTHNAYSIAILDIYLTKEPINQDRHCKTLKKKILNDSFKIINSIGKNISFKLRRYTI